jgi:hypothetical protein
MSEYKIVNRVHPTPAFAQTIAEVEAAENEGLAIPKLKTEFHVPVPKVGDEMKVPFHVGETIRFVETAEASRAPLVGKTEEWQPEEGPLVITREEFEQLKADLVLAFKKMGFDVSL